jgi:hypothetical protein
MGMQTLEISTEVETGSASDPRSCSADPKDADAEPLCIESYGLSRRWMDKLWPAAKALALLGYLAYLVAATVLNAKRSVAVWVISALVAAYVLVGIVWYERIKRQLKAWVVNPGKRFVSTHSAHVTAASVLLALLWFVLWLAFYGAPEPRRLISFVVSDVPDGLTKMAAWGQAVARRIMLACVRVMRLGVAATGSDRVSRRRVPVLNR